MKQKQLKSVLPLFLIAVIAVTAIFSLTACNQEPALAKAMFIFELIEDGQAAYEVEIIEDNVTMFNVKTTPAMVGTVLLELGIIDGEVSQFGLMVKTVDGLYADFNETGAYWQFQLDGEFSMTGVDSTEIQEGVTYAFVYTPA
jgi:hypothetical protein